MRDRGDARAHGRGRLNILVRGTRPFRLLERQDDLPYPAGVVEFLGDRARSRPTPRPLQAARELYAELVEQATDQKLERRRARDDERLPDGGDRGVRRRRQAGAARAALGERPPAPAPCCCAPRSSASSSIDAAQRARTARCASAEPARQASCPRCGEYTEDTTPRLAPHALTATPPRRGSPAPSIAPSRLSTAWTPPKNRLSSWNSTTPHRDIRRRVRLEELSRSIPGSA